MLFTKEKVSEGQGVDYPGALSIRNMDTEALRIEEKRRRTPSRHSRFLTMSPSAKIVTVGIRRGPPSSVGSSINPSSLASQCALLPKDFWTFVSQLQEPSPLCFESSPLRHFRATEEPQTLASQTVSTNSKPQYSSRSILGPGDLKVTAALETTCRMMEKYLLCKNPFPTEPALLVVKHSNLSVHSLGANSLNLGDRAFLAKSV